SFEDVLRDELDAIDATRPLRDPKRYPPAPDTTSVATNGTAGERNGQSAGASRNGSSSDTIREREPGGTHTESLLHRARDRQLVGLALSGGGIRSATFNLGVLQGLAEQRLLKAFDYLSTVSG